MRTVPAALFLIASSFAACPPVAAADDGAQPRIAVVLSGGGARGAAHAGVLKLLEEHRVPVDIVVGTSMGALVGGFYAAGMSPNEIIAWLHELDWQLAAGDRPPRRSLSFRRKQDDYTYALRLQLGYRDGRFILPRGLINAHELGFRLRTQTLHSARWRHFDDMPIRFRAVATDIERGEAVVLDRGSLADAMLASMAVPGVVSPIEIDGRLLLDGGLTENLPVRIARDLGADIVIAVDIATPLAPRESLDDVIGVTAQVVNMLGQESVVVAIASLDDDDLLIRPDVSGIAASDFELMGEAIARGLATEPVIAHRLARLALPPDAWRVWIDGQRRDGSGDWPVIDFITVSNPTTVPDALIRARITQRTGERLSRQALRRDIDALYSLGEFDRIDFELVERDGRQGLRIAVTPKELGPHYLRFGLNIQDDLGGDSAYNLLAMSTRTQMNRLNGEWRNELQIGGTRRVASEWFQPLTARGDWFVQPRLEWLATNFDLFDAGTRIGRYDFQHRSASMLFGWQYRNVGQVAIGPFSDSVDARPRIGSPGLPRFDDRHSGWQWHVIADQLDNWSFPADAWYFEAEGRHTTDYSRAGFFTVTAWEVSDADRVLWSLRAGTRTGGVLPLYEQFTLGGFLSLSGLRQQELRGDHQFQTRIVYYRRLFSLPTALGEGFYAGVSHERGNVWADRSDASLGDLRWGAAAFIGADLVFGALYLGAGRADNGDMSGYLYLQRSFQ